MNNYWKNSLLFCLSQSLNSYDYGSKLNNIDAASFEAVYNSDSIEADTFAGLLNQLMNSGDCACPNA